MTNQEWDIQFRTATFGGYQKQDVLNYLESHTREQTEKFSELQKKLDFSEAVRAETEEALAAKESEIGRLTSENDQRTAALTEAQTKLAEAEAKLADLTVQVDELSAQVRELSAQVANLTPNAKAYEGLSDRIAGIELSAHSRAHTIEAGAERKVKQMKDDAENWLGQLQSAYEQVKADLNAGFSCIGEELLALEARLGAIPKEMDDYDTALQEMKRRAGEIMGFTTSESVSSEEESEVAI